MPNFESEGFVVGSDFEGAEGMFQKPEEERESLDPVELERAREEREIMPDAQERFDSILVEKGWKLIQNPIDYPTLDEWVEFRIMHDRGTKFYPCFVEDQTGKAIFLKVQLSGKEQHLDALSAEATFLKDAEKLPLSNMPKFIDYQPAGEGTLSFLALEAIPFEEGKVAGAEEWRDEHARNAAAQIKQFEELNQDSIPEKIASLPGFQKECNVNAIMVDFVSRAAKYLPKELQGRISSFIKAKPTRQVFAHRDAIRKNIIVKGDGGTMFIDWELSGQGFLGQDAAKLSHNLRENKDAQRAFLNTYLVQDDGLVDQERLQGVKAGIIYQYFVDTLWRIDIGIPEAEAKIRDCELNLPDGQEKNDRIGKMNAKIKTFQEEIRGYVDKIQAVVDEDEEAYPILKLLH